MSRVIYLEALYICIFSGATLWSSCLLHIWANIEGDNIRPTFEILIDVHPSLPTRALLTKIHSDQFISSFKGFLGKPRVNEIISAVINHNLCVAICETGKSIVYIWNLNFWRIPNYYNMLAYLYTTNSVQHLSVQKQPLNDIK